MSADASAHSTGHVLATPIWMVVLRGFQFLVSLIILGLAGRLMHDAYLDEEGLALAIALLTWVAVGYILLTEKIPGLQKAYNVIAVLVLDGLFMIFWLATFAAAAAARARFNVDVNAYGCADDGSTFDSKTCLVGRGVILFKSGAAMLSAIAGLGALVWLLFIATFTWSMVMFFRGRKDGRFLFGAKSDDHQLENQQPFMGQQQGTEAEKIAQQGQPMQSQPQPMQPQSTGGYQVPPAGQYPQAGYQPPVSPQPSVPSQYQAPYAAGSPPQELQNGQQQYGQYPQQPHITEYQGHQGAYPQHGGAVHSPHSELEGQGQPYTMPSPPTASPPPHQ